MPEGVISIGDYAFSRCEVLSTISIPNSVSIIGCNAFSYTKIRGISIPKNVTRIEGQTFGNCTLLSSLTIPSNVTYLDANAFFGCKSLTNIYNYSETPQRIFSNTFATYGTLHVPNGQKEAYMTAEYWKNFNIIDDIRTYNAIDTITNVEDKDSSIYTLDGRLVNDVPKAGIYIKDGKKRIVRF